MLREQGRDISRAMLKGLEKRKQNLEVKLENIAHSINERTDDVVDFKQMGIDHIFVDESHKFKNLMFSTKNMLPCYYLVINQLHTIILRLGTIWKRAKVFTLRFIAYSSMNNLLRPKVVNYFGISKCNFLYSSHNAITTLIYSIALSTLLYIELHRFILTISHKPIDVMFSMGLFYSVIFIFFREL